MKINWVLVSLWLIWSLIMYCFLTAIEYASSGDYKLAFMWLCAGCVEYGIKKIFIDK